MGKEVGWTDRTVGKRAVEWGDSNASANHKKQNCQANSHFTRLTSRETSSHDYTRENCRVCEKAELSDGYQFTSSQVSKVHKFYRKISQN